MKIVMTTGNIKSCKLKGRKPKKLPFFVYIFDNINLAIGKN